MNFRLRRLALLAVVPLFAVAFAFVTAQHSTDAEDSSDVTGNWMMTLTHPHLTESYCAGRMSQQGRSVVAFVTCLGLGHPLVSGHFDESDNELIMTDGDFTFVITTDGTYMTGIWTSDGLAGSGALTGARVPISYGDVNCDLRVDTIDVMLILQYSGRYKHESACMPFGDVNQDGYVDGFDRGEIFGDASIILYYTSQMFRS